LNDIRQAPAAEVEFQRSSQTEAGQHLARLIAFYLPQFHPIPENDAWWGPGFTEWTNVAKARPLYKGHKQPRLPADLGFYDLRLPETRERQADMARDAGIEGFCYWHYWFGGGRRILERVFDEVLASGKPNYPFCLAWANHSWSGVWQGMPKNVLIEQTYPGPADFQAHFHAVLPAFRDPRYLTVGGKPIFLVFSALDLPDTKEFTDLWNELALKAGLPGDPPRQIAARLHKTRGPAMEAAGFWPITK
jgi:lipopolysaccharide biosynthesis protein